MTDGIETTYTPPRWIAFAQAARPILTAILFAVGALLVAVFVLMLELLPPETSWTVAMRLTIVIVLCGGPLVAGPVLFAAATYAMSRRYAESIHMMATGGQLASVTARATVEHRPEPAPMILPPPPLARLEPVSPARMEITREDRIREAAESARRVLMSAKRQPTQANLREWCGVAGGEAAAELQQWMAAAGWCESSGAGSSHKWIDADGLVIPAAALPGWGADKVAEKATRVAGR